MDHERLARLVLGDRPVLFEADFAAHQTRLRAELAGRTVCVVGAGGSIGRAATELLLAQHPRRTLLVDLSENNLAEVTRRLRNRFSTNAPDFEAWALDFSGPAFEALLERERPEIVLNFAAFKHVRSEKDALTLAEMIRINVLGNLRLLRWAAANGPLRRVFIISTDKAVSPASCMGATKRLMEHLLFASVEASPAPAEFVTSTRFANVLFSDGSLTASFIARLAQRQPLAGPSDIQRYFISPRESALLCLLAACHEQSTQLLVPQMQEGDLLSFNLLAERFLAAQGFQAKNYGENLAAAFASLEDDAARGEWPCVFTPSATSGEKPAEEFIEDGEQTADDQPYMEILCLSARTDLAWTTLGGALDRLARQLADPGWLRAADKRDLVEQLGQLVPSFLHMERGRNLDHVI